MDSRGGDKIWNEIGPEKIISESAVPERANELKGITDAWINTNSEYFDLFNWEGKNEQLYRQKAFNEAGVYLLNVLNYEEDINHFSLGSLLTNRVNDRRFIQLTLRNQKNFHHYGYPILYTKYVDTLEPRLTSAVEQIFDRGEFWSSERLPYRYLELYYLSKLFGYQYEQEEKNIIKYTLLNHKPNILLSNISDGYSLTHDIMLCHNEKLYFNDLDNHAGIGEPTSYNVKRVIRGLILRFMASDNPDITLELLLAGILQNQISREMVRLVLSWILEKTQNLDHVPGPLPETSSGQKVVQKNFEEEKSSWKYEYQNSDDETWARNYHTNIVAGMMARVLERYWPKLDNRGIKCDLEDYDYGQKALYLGQLLNSLSNYGLKKGSLQMREIAGSRITTEFPSVFKEAIDFLENQRTQDGKFGYWTPEEILYINKGKSQESFNEDLVKPVSKCCRKALKEAKTDNKK